MFLDTTTRKLQIVLGEVHATNACDIVASFVETDGSTSGVTEYLPITNALSSNGTTAVDVVPAPASNKQRSVREVSFYNRDTVSHTVTLRFYDNGTLYVIEAQTVAAGGKYTYQPGVAKGDTGATGATGSTGPAGAGYDIIMSAAGPRLDGEKLLIFDAVRSYTLLTGLPGSLFNIGTNPSGTVTFNFYKNVTLIGTLQVTSAGAQTLSFASDVSFNPGDLFVITAPSPNDGSMADIGFTIKTFGAEGTTNTQSWSQENRVINGDFVVDQRFEFAATTPAAAAATTQLADCWNCFTTQASKLTFQVTADGPGEATRNSMLVTTAVALTAASTDDMSFGQNIEGPMIADAYFGTASAQSIFVSFWVKASLTGVYAIGLRNSAKNRRYMTTFTVNNANTWQYVTLPIPGDTAGTWLTAENTIGLRVDFDMGAGSNFRGSVNTTTWSGSSAVYAFSGTSVRLVANLGATFQVTNVRIRVGATFDMPYAPRPFEDELFLCQRYYYKTFKRSVAPAQNAGLAGALSVMNPVASGRPSIWVPFAATMANPSPTITTFNPSAANANWRDITAAADVVATVDAGGTKGPDGVMISAAAVTNAADVLAIHLTAEGGL